MFRGCIGDAFGMCFTVSDMCFYVLCMLWGCVGDVYGDELEMCWGCVWDVWIMCLECVGYV